MSLVDSTKAITGIKNSQWIANLSVRSLCFSDSIRSLTLRKETCETRRTIHRSLREILSNRYQICTLLFLSLARLTKDLKISNISRIRPIKRKKWRRIGGFPYAVTVIIEYMAAPLILIENRCWLHRINYEERRESNVANNWTGAAVHVNSFRPPCIIRARPRW